MNENMIFSVWLIGIVATAIVLVVVCWTVVTWTAFSKVGAGSEVPLHALTTARGVLQFVTVLLVIVSALILAINKIINPEAAVAMLSAALGYAFGHATQSNKDENSN